MSPCEARGEPSGGMPSISVTLPRPSSWRLGRSRAPPAPTPSRTTITALRPIPLLFSAGPAYRGSRGRAGSPGLRRIAFYPFGSGYVSRSEKLLPQFTFWQHHTHRATVAAVECLPGREKGHLGRTARAGSDGRRREEDPRPGGRAGRGRGRLASFSGERPGEARRAP